MFSESFVFVLLFAVKKNTFPSCDFLGLKKDAISYSTEMAHSLRRWQWTYSLLAEAVTASGGEKPRVFLEQQ